MDECTEIVKEVKLANIIFVENENKNSCKCIPCTVYIVLFFTINVGGVVFIHNGIKKRFTT